MLSARGREHSALSHSPPHPYESLTAPSNLYISCWAPRSTRGATPRECGGREIHVDKKKINEEKVKQRETLGECGFMKVEEGKSFRKKGTVNFTKHDRMTDGQVRWRTVSTECGNLVVTYNLSKRQWCGWMGNKVRFQWGKEWKGMEEVEIDGLGSSLKETQCNPEGRKLICN